MTIETDFESTIISDHQFNLKLFSYWVRQQMSLAFHQLDLQENEMDETSKLEMKI